MTPTVIRPGTIVATFIGLVGAVIVWATLTGTSLPLISSDRVALVTLVILGFAMCVSSGFGSTGQLPTGPLPIVAGLAGVLTLVILGAAIFGWTAVLDPFAGVMYGNSAAAPDKVAVLLVGVLIGIS
jgi:hypothetical protein